MKFYMEPTNLDVYATQDIVNMGDLDEINDSIDVQSSQYGDRNAPLALPPFTNKDQDLVPVGMSNILPTSCSDKRDDRASKKVSY